MNIVTDINGKIYSKRLTRKYFERIERYKCNRTLYFVKHEECYYWTNGNTISEKQLNDKFYKYYSCGKDVYVLKNNGRRN